MDQVALASIASWLETPLQILVVIIGVGFLVFVHELGHFLVAKMQGVKVERFAIGLGRKIVGFTWRDTEYALCAIPFGGYVKMAGEYPDQERKGADYEFYSKPPGRRALIVIAGVVMNAIVGILIFIAAFRMGVLLNAPEIEPSPGGPAWIAGLQEGDVILEANETKINSLTDLAHVVMVSDGDIALKIRRGDEVFSENVTPEQDEELGIRTIGVGTRSAMAIDGVVAIGEDMMLRPSDVTDWRKLCGDLSAETDGKPSPVARLRELLPEESRAAVKADGEGLSDADKEKITWGINCVMARRDLYDKESFAGAALSEDIRRKAESGLEGLRIEDALKVNRRLVGLSLPGSLAEVSEPVGKKVLEGDTVVAAGEEVLVS
jgi:hypothetical protein